MTKAFGPWRKTLVVNGPTAVRGRKAKLLPLPARFDAIAAGVERRGADSFGICEASTRTWQRLHGHHGYPCHRGRPNDRWSPSNVLGNHNYWTDDAYRSAGRRNLNVDAGPKELGLNMPLTLLVDRAERRARHAELTVHNYAKRDASPAARAEVVDAVLELVVQLHRLGILVVLRGDLNAAALPGASKAGLRHAGRLGVLHIYVSKPIETRPARPLVKGWGGQVTDHHGALLLPFRVPHRKFVPLPLV